MSILGKDFTGELEDLLKILLERQENKNKTFNTELSYAYSHMLLKHESLKESNIQPILTEASKHLSKWSFKRFTEAYNESLHYIVEYNLDNSFDVYRLKEQIKSPRQFITKQSKCKCISSITFQEQCVHEIKLLGKFDLTKFSRRHLIRSGITMNKYIHGYNNPHCFSHLRIEKYKFRISEII